MTSSIVSTSDYCTSSGACCGVKARLCSPKDTRGGTVVRSGYDGGNNMCGAVEMANSLQPTV
eukprot:CAMPEP_0198679446 /NCGR_PEP_ID=MMETSP1468-20131203/2753_1 /TAXON_ID=1461545 /ORGANISM="Mantoniella sp, Strain CCMP1436" /LENGTH=61 /DNA_ID=CAMNT_0044418169 /DNA_START=425 /DNA_END=610 /DNA_ORIENTATION=-